MDAHERIVSADDLIRGGCCREGVMKSARPELPAAMPIKAVLAEAKRRKRTDEVMAALKLDGYGYGYGDGDGDGDGGDE